MPLAQSISSATTSLPPQTPESLPQWVLIAKEILPAIGSLWPLLLILTVAGFLIYYRKEAGNILGRGFKFKGAGAEIEVPPTAAVTTIATAVMERVGQPAFLQSASADLSRPLRCPSHPGIDLRRT